MKSQIHKRLALVAVLFSLVLVVTNATAIKPVKEDKPDKTTAECIAFTGHLETVPVSEIVEGCCPNAGPWPAYTMTLTVDLQNEDGTITNTSEEYDGQLFINGGGSGPNQSYKVQFWSWDSDEDEDIPGDGDIFFEITGGVVDYDRKSKFLSVNFTEEQPSLWLYDEWNPETNTGAIVAPVLPVSFGLIRTSDLSYCE